VALTRVGAGDRAAVREQLRLPGYIGYRLLLRPRPGFSPYWEHRYPGNGGLAMTSGYLWMSC